MAIIRKGQVHDIDSSDMQAQTGFVVNLFQSQLEIADIGPATGWRVSHQHLQQNPVIFFVGVQTNFDPSSGPTLLLSAFEAVILGGLGSVWGTLAGGIALGVAQAVAASVDVSAEVLAGHLVFLIVMLIRPQGIFGGRAA